MKNLLYCLPLYLFCAGCLLTLLYYFIPVVINLIKMIPKRVVNISLAGFLTISVLYVVITSLFI